MMKYQIIPVTAYQQNCTLLWCEETQFAAVVDPGGDINHIIEQINHANVQLTYVFLTHGHLDHIAAAKKLANHFSVPILGPQQEDKFLFDTLPEQTKMFGFPHAEAFSPDRWLSDGDSIPLGKERFDILYCPGHTPGHIAFYNRERQITWVGDILFYGSIGRTDFPGGNYDQLIHSIKTKLMTLPDNVTVVPGHGPTTTIGHERATNPFLKG